jgi:hypothetical protein
LTVEEAIDSTLAGPLMVKGFIVADGCGAVWLCTAVAEPFPPQCGEPTLKVEGLDLDAVDGSRRVDGDPRVLRRVIALQGARLVYYPRLGSSKGHRVGEDILSGDPGTRAV